MQRKLILNKQGTKLCLSLHNGQNGDLKARVSSKFGSEDDFKKAADTLDVSAALLKRIINAYEQTGISEIDLAESCVVHIRSMYATDSTPYSGPTYKDAFTAALKAQDLECEDPVIVWSDTEYLCALDVDVKDRTFSTVDLLSLEGVPTPFVSWVTKGHGLRLCYHDQDDFTAAEITSVAYLTLSRQYPDVTLELKSETRHPAYDTSTGEGCGEVVYRVQQFNPAHLRRHLGMFTVSDDAVIDWLLDQNFQIGERYDHDRCPVAPSATSHGKPVIVGEKGITCFVCDAKGVCAGSSKPGFFPYSHFCGGTRTSLLYVCMENATHWEHAKFVVENQLQLSIKHAELVYSAGMILHGHDRDTIRQAMLSGEDFIRINNRWTNIRGEPYTKDIRAILATLPTASDRDRVARLDQTFDLTSYGYPSITPVYGCFIWHHHIRPTNNRINAVIQTGTLADPSFVSYRPSYRQRLSENDAWAVIERVFPNIDRNYVLLLVAARGVYEGDLANPPMIFATGPTSSGKSLSVSLAASICGDKNTEVVWSTNIDRVRQAILDASSSYVTFNEVFKEAARQIKDTSQAMDYILNLTPDSTSWAAYVGPVRMGRVPVMVFTDTELSSQVKQDAQLARRILHVPLTRQVDWERTLLQSGVGKPVNFRTSSLENAEACNTILSLIIDRFFRHPTSLEHIATEIGYNQIRQSDETERGLEELRRFFKLVCDAPEITEPKELIRWSGRGWKLIRQNLETDLKDAWVALGDSKASRRCTEVDWQQLVGATEPVIFEAWPCGAKTAVRFKNAAGNRKTYLVNQELL